MKPNTAELIPSNDEITELTGEEIIARIRRGLAKRRAQMSVREFIENFRSNKLDDPGRVADLIVLLNLLSETEQLKFAGAAR
jgi:hypothetical protein